MNWYKKNRNSQDEILHDTFIAYLATALQRRRQLYIEQLKKAQRANNSLDRLLNAAMFDAKTDKEDGLPLLLQLESEKLQNALMNLSERERYIFLAFVLEEKNYTQLAQELDVGYKGVAAIYYRTLKKLKDSLRGDHDDL